MAFSGVYFGRQVEDGNGAPVSGAKIYFYLSGTSTEIAAYSDKGLTTPAANPLEADASGYFDAYLDPTKNYDVVIRSADDATTFSTASIRAIDSDAVNSSYEAGDYGVKADGVTDDSEALQAAIDTVEDQGGGTLYIPEGTMIVSSTLVINTNNVTLAGRGKGSIIQGTNSLSPIVRVGNVSGGGVDGVILKDFALTRAGSATTGVIGLEVADWNNLWIDTLAIYNHGYPLKITGPTGSIGIQCVVANTHIWGAYNNYAWLFGGAGLFFTNCEFGKNGFLEPNPPSACIKIEGSTNDVRFTSCNFIPRRDTGTYPTSPTSMLEFDNYTNSTGVIYFTDILSESIQYAIKSDSGTALINDLRITGGRIACDDAFWNLDAATELKVMSFDGANISATSFNCTVADWCSITGGFFGCAVSITGSDADSDLVFMGNTCTGNLTFAGTFGALTYMNQVDGTLTDSATVTNRAAVTQDMRTSASPQFGGIELGHASDTTLSRSAAGILAVEGVDQVNVSASQTITNKTLSNTSKVRAGSSSDITVFNERMAVEDSTLPLAIYRVTSGASNGVVELYSDVGGTKTKNFEIAADGDVTNTNNSYGAISDRSLKDDVNDVASYWDRHKAVRYVTYRLKQGGPDAPKLMGVIAQEAAEIFPGLVPDVRDPTHKPAPFNFVPPEGFDDLTSEEKSELLAEAEERWREGEEAAWPTVKGFKYSVLGMISSGPVMQEAQARIERLEGLVSSLINGPGPDSDAEARLTEALEQLEKAQANMEERKPEPAAEEPPADIADLIDPSLTARQNHDALTKKYKDAMSDHYRLLSYGTQEHKIEAQKQLEKAQRFESGITWNRARLAEVV